MKYPWQNILYIDALGKTIPYQNSARKKNSGADFVNLKANPAATESILETVGQPELQSALKAINKAETGVFSVGCQVENIVDKAKHQTTGYLEFAINDQSLVADSTSYYSLFFQFQNRLAQSAFPHVVQFDWVIMPALFTEVSLQGFTCSVKINTAFCATARQAQTSASAAFSLLGVYLANIEQSTGNRIY